MTTSGDSLTYWILISMIVVLLGITIYILKNALSVLHENGKSLTFAFPVFNRMAHNGRTVSILLFILAVVGVIWAITFKG